MSDIKDFRGISLGFPAAASLVNSTLRLADEFHVRTAGGGLQAAVEAPRLVVIAALSVSNAVLAFSSATCTLGNPPEEIGAVTDSDGKLILRCGHSPPHEWDYQTGATR